MALTIDITKAPIDADFQKQRLANPQAGALVTFEGWVRNHNEGRSVAALAYECYEALARSEGLQVLQETAQRYALLDAACIHRVGPLEIGEMAVWVGVVAPHREAAFMGCKAIIDQIKVRLPIWKQEWYADGSVAWVNCRQCARHHHDDHHHHHSQKDPVYVPSA